MEEAKCELEAMQVFKQLVEQDHRNVKRRITITTGFKEFDSAQRTLAGIEIINIIRKNQIIDSKSTTFKTFYSLAS
nr:DDE-type integrase/transposase/recombinase [Draconibacterium mangrovi]